MHLIPFDFPNDVLQCFMTIYLHDAISQMRKIHDDQQMAYEKLRNAQ